VPASSGARVYDPQRSRNSLRAEINWKPGRSEYGPLRLTEPRSRRAVPFENRRLNMFDDLSDLYQQVILDHCKRPRNFHEMPGADRSAQGHNPLCGDQLKMFLAMDGEVINDISFVGSGCCISKASASLLTDAVKGKTRDEVQQLFDKIHEMVMTGEIKGDVGKLAVFAGVHKFPARVKCAILAWHAVLAALKGDGEQPVTTETETT
jgi:nitrogen fixation NifU-like protein